MLVFGSLVVLAWFLAEVRELLPRGRETQATSSDSPAAASDIQDREPDPREDRVGR